VRGHSVFFLFVIAKSEIPHLSLRTSRREPKQSQDRLGTGSAIPFVIGHFRDYFVVWFLTRTDGIASPAFGGLAMTEGVKRAQ